MELPTPIHIIYIPGIFFLGLFVGWALRGKLVIKGDDEE
jgi:hypothetical protein